MEIQYLFDEIRGQGKKLTKTRRELVRLFANEHQLLTAAQIHEHLLKHGIRVNKTTVYRELAFLVKQKMIAEVSIQPGLMHYENARQPHHHHVTCLNCGKIAEIVPTEFEQPIQQVTQRLNIQGFQITRHQLEFYGRCHACH
jgi:Fe2+ or Zn2+ uptake regulation protein